MMKLRYDAASYVLEKGNAYHKLKLAHILGKEEDYPPLVDDLLSTQNEDGGWPWLQEAGNPSGVSDTAKVLELLAQVGVEPSSEPIRNGASYLLERQNEDGGWSESSDLAGIILREWTWVSTKHSGYQTADAVNALFEAGFSGEETGRAVEFLLAAQNEEGGWDSHVGPRPNPGSDVATTDHIITALLRHGESRDSAAIRGAEGMLREKLGEMDSPVNMAAALSCFTELGYPPGDRCVAELVDRLIEAQRPDGGWNWFGDLPSNPSQTVDCLEQLEKFVKLEPS
jgi:hypothetical protein